MSPHDYEHMYNKWLKLKVHKIIVIWVGGHNDHLKFKRGHDPPGPLFPLPMVSIQIIIDARLHTHMCVE